MKGANESFVVIKGLMIWRSKCHRNSPVVSDGYVKYMYEEAEVDRLAIMQDFQENEKKRLKNGCQSAIVNFISVKSNMGYPCVRPYILFINIHGPDI